MQERGSKYSHAMSSDGGKGGATEIGRESVGAEECFERREKSRQALASLMQSDMQAATKRQKPLRTHGGGVMERRPGMRTFGDCQRSCLSGSMEQEATNHVSRLAGQRADSSQVEDPRG